MKRSKKMKLKRLVILLLVLSVSLFTVSCDLLFGSKDEESFKVNFETDGGTVVEAQLVVKGGLVTKPADPTKEGHTFTGWYLDGEEWDFDNDVVNANIALTAGWEELHTHTVVVDEAVAPTCTNDGLTEGSHCSECGEILEEQETVPALGHRYIVNNVAPGCITGGYDEHICTACGDSYKDNAVDPLGHTPGEAATCDLPQVCSVCTTLITPALGHIAREDAYVAPTCTVNGWSAGATCSVCGEVLIAQNMIPALGHTVVVDAAVAADCENAGLTEGSHCSVCNEGIVAQEIIPALGHTVVVDAAKAADCENSGLTEGSHCSACGTVLVAQEVIPALSHTVVVDAAVAADCENAGLTEGEHCSVCNKVIVAQEIIPALGHTASEDAYKAPTCTESGWSTGATCSVCGEVLEAQEIIPALGHTEVIDAPVAADCLNTGLTEGKHCGACGEVLVAQEDVPALGHTAVTDAPVAADCENTGLTEGKHCSVCSEVIIAQDVIPALGHTVVVDASVAADCENTGLTEGKHCSVCDKVILAQNIVPAKGHVEYVDEAVKPTCINDGLTAGKHCSVCNKVLVAQVVDPATGVHVYVDGMCNTDGCGAIHPDWVKVTYVLHGGENAPENVELYMKGVYPELFDAVREGYTFRGWYDSISYNNKIESLFGIDEDITLYALWVKSSSGGSGNGSTTTPEVPI